MDNSIVIKISFLKNVIFNIMKGLWYTVNFKSKILNKCEWEKGNANSERQ